MAFHFMLGFGLAFILPVWTECVWFTSTRRGREGWTVQSGLWVVEREWNEEAEVSLA